MKRNFWRLVGLGVLLMLGILSGIIFNPRHYNVPAFHQVPGTQFWSLTTGSKIGFIHIPAKGLHRPTPVIFLQGGPGGFISERRVNSLAPLADAGFDIYLYDQAGSGSSGKLHNIEDYTAERHVRDLAAIIDKIGTGKVILLGQSWGAMLAVLYTARHQDRVEKLILTGPGPIPPIRVELAGLNAPDSLHLKTPQASNAEGNRKAGNLRMRFTSWYSVAFGKKLIPDEEADSYQTFLNQELNKSVVCDTTLAPKAEGGGGFYVQLMTLASLSATRDPRPLLRNCKVPLLEMKGQCDNLKWGFSTEYLELFKDHKLVIVPGAGHSISVEQPTVYISTILDFLNH
ncbi:MAG: alpha/beta hydrolase [Bacteroidetes bacterium]|nr:alpha/beta hydrolase [Bacteroidota bacterium]